MLNKVMLIGHVGGAPETHATKDDSSKTFVTFSVATNEKYRDKNNILQTKTEWHAISAFGKLAEICMAFLRKGSKVYIEGSNETREWTDKEGKKHRSTQIRANSVVFLQNGKHEEEEIMVSTIPEDDLDPMESIPW